MSAKSQFPGIFSKTAERVSYPGTILMCLAVFALFGMMGLSVMLAAYASVLIGAVLITVHEILLPFRQAWKPSIGEIGTDTVFMFVVQLALPSLLSISVVIYVAQALQSSDATVEHLWPADLPIAIQALFMLLVADFFRYWMHRGFHKFTPLWRFHAVHHSPHRLYWLNVGRFHPIEKTVQYAVDALPFALLGVSTEVLALYFVFFAINGFYQHSNCRVRLGPLNYLVSGPELHRWHHSRLAHESDNNFGNNLIVWDVLFGTRLLPATRQVAELGLPNEAYPQGFWAQMATPFRRGLEKG